jgi:hypothetical protein
MVVTLKRVLTPLFRLETLELHLQNVHHSNLLPNNYLSVVHMELKLEILLILVSTKMPLQLIMKEDATQTMMMLNKQIA